MDYLFAATVRLVRLGDTYRLGANTAPPAELIEEQERLKATLNKWIGLFKDFDTRHPEQVNQVSKAFVMTRYESSQIWHAVAFFPFELAYDRYLDRFGRII
ncbi:hypothetical protein CCHL11_06449 [Colletotrichum chlorophyti]|uniref:Uncharacterized protein n=1 Tax=Colletotrichum chlorophyti TaxID=708187 RepID=A0A1Q8RQ53_9PEZI|nr:hypothetical protein CCHL11_06449 [Colletotrichum chlorophyti]